MEQTSGPQNNHPGRRTPAWLSVLLCAVILVLILALVFLALLHFNVISCAKKGAEPTSPAPIAAQTDSGQTQSTEAGQPETQSPDTQQPAETKQQPEAGSEQPPIDVQQPSVTEQIPSSGAAAGTPSEKPADDPGKDPAGSPVENPSGDPAEEPTPTPTPEPIEAPAEEPTPTPTPEPVKEPAAKPTAIPDTFTLGGKKVKTGSTKIIGSKLGINGKSKKATHITPEEVQDLVNLCPDLEELELDYCYMDDYTPLGKLKKLKKLQLAYCGSGTQSNSIRDISWVKDLTNLTRLNLKYNKIDDTEPLAGLTKLTYLNLGSNPLEDEDLKPISKLTNLTTLYLYDGKKITDVSPLAKLTKLTFLHIGHNSKLKNVKPLTSLKKLQQLRLNNTKFSDLSYIGKFKALKKLDLSNCPIDTDKIAHLKECKKLKTVVLAPTDHDTWYAIVDMTNPEWDVKTPYSW